MAEISCAKQGKGLVENTAHSKRDEQMSFQGACPPKHFADISALSLVLIDSESQIQNAQKGISSSSQLPNCRKYTRRYQDIYQV